MPGYFFPGQYAAAVSTPDSYPCFASNHEVWLWKARKYCRCIILNRWFFSCSWFSRCVHYRSCRLSWRGQYWYSWQPTSKLVPQNVPTLCSWCMHQNCWKAGRFKRAGFFQKLEVFIFILQVRMSSSPVVYFSEATAEMFVPSLSRRVVAASWAWLRELITIDLGAVYDC